MTKRIVFTGGHHTPALAVMEALDRGLKRSGLEVRYYWLGHRHSIWGDRNDSVEFKEVTERGIPFFDLKAGKFYKTFHPLKLLRIPFGFIRALSYLIQINPDLIVSFGGYLAVPVVLAARIKGIPIMTHEQTASAGWASRVVSRFAQKVFISFESSARFFPPEKTILTGNPVRSDIFVDRGLYRFEGEKMSVYITGGKQGSHIINKFVEENIIRLVETANILHQCGSSSTHNDLPRLLALKDSLPLELRERYVVKDFFGGQEIGSVFSRANIVVSRAGANSVFELGVLGKPAILVPIPWSSHDEQRLNACLLSRAGGAVVIEERDLTAGKFFSLLDKMISNYDLYHRKALGNRAFFRTDADKIMAREISGFIFELEGRK